MSEITIKTAYSEDGTTITYDVMGHGPHLILLHGGFLQTRQAWHDVGYVKQFAKAYTTIAIDLRGHGQSGSPISPSFYAADKIIADILSVADAEAMTQFALVGFFVGAITALQVAANSNRVGCAIIVGGGFGPLFTEQEHAEQVNWVKSIMEATEAGQVDELDLDPKWRDAILQANLYTQLAWTQALFTWPIIKPQNIHCSALVVAGSANQKSVENMKVFKTDMEDAGIQHAIVDGLDHAQEFSDPQSVLPIYHKFLQDYFI